MIKAISLAVLWLRRRASDAAPLVPPIRPLDVDGGPFFTMPLELRLLGNSNAIRGE